MNTMILDFLTFLDALVFGAVCLSTVPVASSDFLGQDHVRGLRVAQSYKAQPPLCLHALSARFSFGQLRVEFIDVLFLPFPFLPDNDEYNE